MLQRLQAVHLVEPGPGVAKSLLEQFPLRAAQAAMGLPDKAGERWVRGLLHHHGVRVGEQIENPDRSEATVAQPAEVRVDGPQCPVFVEPLGVGIGLGKQAGPVRRRPAVVVHATGDVLGGKGHLDDHPAGCGLAGDREFVQLGVEAHRPPHQPHRGVVRSEFGEIAARPSLQVTDKTCNSLPCVWEPWQLRVAQLLPPRIA